MRVAGWLSGVVALVVFATGVHAQAGGSLIGRVTTREGEPVAGATIALVGDERVTTSDAQGRFVISAIPPGERAIRVERLGFRTAVIEGIIISLGRTSTITVQLDPQPVEVGGVTVSAERVRLIEPDVSVTREIVLGREMRALPVDRLDEIIELTPGVSGGHFRGGRIGQEVHVVDGLEVKNRLEASAHGPGLELPPTALEQVEVITGGMPASFGAALSGAVSYVTRRGSRQRWNARASTLTDQWAPESLFRGFTQFSVSAGGPVRPLGDQATLFIDALLQGMADADPRARGLTCLRPDDADSAVAELIASLRNTAPSLYCPYTGETLPHQRGDKWIGFARLDVPLGDEVNLTFSGLRNRLQRELYTPEWRYNAGHQLGQRSTGTLVSATVDWNRSAGGRARQLGARVAFMRLDRYLGAIDRSWFDDRASIAGFGFSRMRFLGEDFVRRPIEEQLTDGRPVPGYVAPGGITGSPFGSAGAGIFFTDGTPDVANWTRSDAFIADLFGEWLSASGSLIRMGGNLRWYRIESYERLDAHLAGSSPGYARFYPATVAGYVDARLAGDDRLNVSLGLRVEAFRSGVRFRRDRDDFLAPVIEPDWQVAVLPRLGVALPMPGTDGRTAIRFNYGQVAQPPDFRFFLDTTIGDSLRTAIQRQGNPELSFERGRSYEIGLSQILGRNVGVAITAFRKELRELASGGLQLGSTGNSQYSTNDFGKVTGLELSLRAEWPGVTARAGWSLQQAVGVSSGTDADTLVSGDAATIERPLAFDQRHAIDVALLFFGAAGSASPWSLAITSSTRSGYPLDRRAAAGDTVLPGKGSYLPWTSTTDVRVGRTLGRLPGCRTCTWRIVADARNVFGADNILALRRETGTLAPSIETIRAVASTVPLPAAPIPRESPLYSHRIDLDGNGLISIQEFDTARTAAALDRFDPSVFFGEARSVRLGIEVVF